MLLVNTLMLCAVTFSSAIGDDDIGAFAGIIRGRPCGGWGREVVPRTVDGKTAARAGAGGESPELVER